MDQFLEKYILPPFTEYEIDNLNSPHYLDTPPKETFQKLSIFPYQCNAKILREW